MDQCIQFETDRGTSVLGQEERIGIPIDVKAAHAAAKVAQANWARRAHADRLALLGEMSASIVHEITQPLAAIATNAQTGRLWLERATPDIDKALGTITRIIDAADRAAKMIQLVRAMAMRIEPEMSSVDLNEVVGEALALVQSEALDRHILLRPVLASGLPPIRGNRTQLQQVIINLVLNSLQAMEAAGDRTTAVVIRTSRYGWPLRTAAWALIRKSWIACSVLSIRPSRREWAWGFRSAVRLPMSTAENCAPSEMPVPE